jgi:hypothetical protein
MAIDAENLLQKEVMAGLAVSSHQTEADWPPGGWVAWEGGGGLGGLRGRVGGEGWGGCECWGWKGGARGLRAILGGLGGREGGKEAGENEGTTGGNIGKGVGAGNQEGGRGGEGKCEIGVGRMAGVSVLASELFGGNMNGIMCPAGV